MSNKHDYDKLAAKIRYRQTVGDSLFFHVLGSLYAVLFSIAIPALIFIAIGGIFLGEKGLNVFFTLLSVVLGLLLYFAIIRNWVREHLVIYFGLVFLLNTAFALTFFWEVIGWQGIGIIILLSVIAHLIVYVGWIDHEENVLN